MRSIMYVWPTMTLPTSFVRRSTKALSLATSSFSARTSCMHSALRRVVLRSGAGRGHRLIARLPTSGQPPGAEYSRKFRRARGAGSPRAAMLGMPRHAPPDRDRPQGPRPRPARGDDRARPLDLRHSPRQEGPAAVAPIAARRGPPLRGGRRRRAGATRYDECRGPHALRDLRQPRARGAAGRGGGGRRAAESLAEILDKTGFYAQSHAPRHGARRPRSRGPQGAPHPRPHGRRLGRGLERSLPAPPRLARPGRPPRRGCRRSRSPSMVAQRPRAGARAARRGDPARDASPSSRRR